jgi:cytosine/adenosine deaminase-related metal-dependent hydrolase
LIHYQAAWVLPIAGAPLRDGWVAVDCGRIAAVGPAPPTGVQVRPLGSVAVLPGLVNAHTHLELSHLRERVPPSREFVTWVRNLVALRGRHADSNQPEILDAVAESIDASVRCGTALVGDISNTLVTVAALARSHLCGVVFYELIRFKTADAARAVDKACRRLAELPYSDRVRTSLAAHAPYSVSLTMFQAIRNALDRRPPTPCSVHLSESREEIEFIRSGHGPWRMFLEDVGAWDDAWCPPGCSPVQFLDESGFLGAHVLAVHGVQMTRADLARLAARDATLVTCPRSNRYTGAGDPPLADFYASGVRIAVGTDSLASAPDLNVFAELAVMRALAPEIAARALLESATRHGARALGFDADYGTIEPGKRARLLAVTIPHGLDDVEEYLVSGIPPEAVQWID